MRGVIWYQGEANGEEGLSYLQKMRALIGGWRQLWGRGDFPFYFVQLASIGPPDPNNAAGGNGWPRLREAQLQTLAVTNTGMAVTIDIGDAGDIHPRNKQDVGVRLARWALARDYKLNCVPSGPLFKGFSVQERGILLSFDFVGAGLMAGEKQAQAPVKELAGGKLGGFAVAGADKAWQWADAVISGSNVLVSCAKIPRPVAVRYAWQQNPSGANLYNKDGLPASPFRTDNW